MSTLKFKNPETGAWEKLGAPSVDAYSKSETDALIAAAGGIQMVKLWENPNPKAEFAAQTINVDSSYECYVIDHANHDGYFVSQKCDKNILCSLCSVTVNSAGYGIHTRKVTINDDGSCVFEGAFGTDKTTPYVNNHLCIPRKIYGIKGVL
jgi:hypothetical protein